MIRGKRGPLCRWLCATLAAIAIIAFTPAESREWRSEPDDEAGRALACGKGEIFDPDLRACQPLRAGVLDDDSLLAHARTFADAGRYEDALAVLAAMREPDTAPALNLKGFATRKAGRVEEGIAHYRRALALDPDLVEAREYLGEAYLTLNRVDLAREQLAEIEKRCGRFCEAFEDLDEAIARATASP